MTTPVGVAGSLRVSFTEGYSLAEGRSVETDSPAPATRAGTDPARLLANAILHPPSMVGCARCAGNSWASQEHPFARDDTRMVAEKSKGRGARTPRRHGPRIPTRVVGTSWPVDPLAAGAEGRAGVGVTYNGKNSYTSFYDLPLAYASSRTLRRFCADRRLPLRSPAFRRPRLHRLASYLLVLSLKERRFSQGFRQQNMRGSVAQDMVHPDQPEAPPTRRSRWRPTQLRDGPRHAGRRNITAEVNARRARRRPSHTS